MFWWNGLSLLYLDGWFSSWTHEKICHVENTISSEAFRERVVEKNTEMQSKRIM